MTPKRHYAQKAAAKFVRNTPYTTPDEAIQAGARTNEQFEAFIHREAQAFWSANGQRARRKVKSRHRVRRKSRAKNAVNTQILGNGCQIGTKKPGNEVLALEKRAQEWSKISGLAPDGRFSQRLCLDRQARAAYELYLDFVRYGVAGDFTCWLERYSGVARRTCLNRLRAGIALAMGMEIRFHASKPILRYREPQEST